MSFNNSNDDDVIINNNNFKYENEIFLITLITFSIIFLYIIYKAFINTGNNTNTNINTITITNDLIIDENSSIIISIGEKPDTCIICYENDCNIILSCHHNIICKYCLLLLLKNKNNTCPLCRNIFTNYYINK